ncbi:MAG: COG1615 family transporter [Candidatus Kuenenia sp.]|nr:COG1615 family transporter [Candidatus Kuenenia hertensis]
MIVIGILKRSFTKVLSGVVFFAFTILFFWFLSFWGEMLWFESLKYTQRFWMVVFAQIGFVFAGFLFGGIVVNVLTCSINKKRKYLQLGSKVVGGVMLAAFGDPPTGM